MKAKLYICAAIAACTTMAFSSCEDMLKVDSKVVLYQEDHNLDNATDTLYSVMGILQGIQRIADRTVLLGEMRGGLVTTTDQATDDLNEIYSFNFKSIGENNRYDRAVDYYNIINNCNYFLAKADTSYYRANESVFLPEYVAVLCYRAWTYLQVAQIYGKVPWVDKPVLTGSDALASNYEKLDVKQIATRLLKDFKPEYANVKTPQYGSLGGTTNGDGSQSQTHKSEQLFIPYELILGDLYLWAEKYDSAAIQYHAFLNDENKPIHVGTGSILWLAPDFMYLGEDTYSSMFGEKMDPICYIPMESEQYGGYVSDLENVFNSTKKNYYYAQATRSNALTYLSENQNYTYHKINAQSLVVVPTHMVPKTMKKDNEELLRGDLRLQSILKVKSVNVDDEEETSAIRVNDKRQTLSKINKEKICLYRGDVVYLRLAEALNRAGLPQTAFYILKCGLNYESIDYGTEYEGIQYSAPISAGELQRAAEKGMSEIYDWNTSEFDLAIRERVTLGPTNREINGHTTTTEYVVYYAPTGMNVKNTYLTMGIHSRGCGNADIDSTFVIKVQPGATLDDSIRAVEEMIIDEMALETCFEGYRFGDLLRVSIHRASTYDNPNTDPDKFADNEFLAKRVAARETATYEDYKAYDPSLFGKLRGDDPWAFNDEWFLCLPDVKQKQNTTN